MTLCRKDLRPVFDALLDNVVSTVASIHAQVRLGGASFLVAIIPTEFQVSPELRAALEEHAGTRPADYDIDLPQRALIEAFEARGIDSVDLLPAFREEGERRPLYRLRDTHWNQEGNALAAEVLLRHLRGGEARETRRASPPGV